MSQLPPEYLDSATPSDVEVTDRVRLRYPDPTLRLEVPAAAEAAAGHPLVTVGDSLTHGMSSGAVFDTRLSWPAIVARSLRVDLSMPDYAGPLGGIPFNIEGLLRGLQDEFGDRLSGLELLKLPLTLQRLADSNEDYWERGAGSVPPPPSATRISVSTAGTSATAFPTQRVSPRPGWPGRPRTTTSSARSRRMTATSPRVRY
jgi:hypothetical protein